MVDTRSRAIHHHARLLVVHISQLVVQSERVHHMRLSAVRQLPCAATRLQLGHETVHRLRILPHSGVIVALTGSGLVGERN